jgi:hypothetical protein
MARLTYHGHATCTLETDWNRAAVEILAPGSTYEF